MTTTLEPTKVGSDFARLSRRVTAAGLLRPRPGYYVLRLSLVALAFVGGWAAFLAVGASWWTLLVAVFMAVVYAQVALVAHDLAHRQIFRRRQRSEVAGLLVGNLGIGMSYGWWMDKHTRHHANPNHEDLDPDVAPDLLIWSQDATEGRRGVKRFINAHQGYLFFPLLTLLGLSLRQSSIKALRKGGMRHRGLEAALFGVHIVGYLAVLALVLNPLQALAFFVVHQALFGVYLGCTFAPNHKGMPIPDGTEDFLRKQVLTSRNVKGGPLTDVALGGLNYQIEHHLFPSMPTPNLRKAQPIVREFCAEIGVSYCETGLIASYSEALRHLHEVGAPLRNGQRSAPLRR